jgi:hypothetical protein
MHRIQLDSTNEVGTFVFAAGMSRPRGWHDPSKITVIAKILERDGNEWIEEVLDQYQE